MSWFFIRDGRGLRALPTLCEFGMIFECVNGILRRTCSSRIDNVRTIRLEELVAEETPAERENRIRQLEKRHRKAIIKHK